MPRAYARVGPSRPAAGPVLAVGWRAVVTGRDGRSSRIVLTDDDGTTALGTLAPGLEVEILAWRPYGARGTRYRVLSHAGGLEGWLGAANLVPSRLPSPVKKPAAGATPGRIPAAGPRPLVVSAPRTGRPPVAVRRAPIEAVVPVKAVKQPARVSARKRR